MRWELCRKTHARLQRIVGALEFTHVKAARIFCVRGYGSTSEAWARIWGLPALWQQVLGIGPAYVVEIIEPEFSRLPPDEQDRILIHELLHIPRTFSGALRPHRTPTFRINRRTVERFYQRYLEANAGNGSTPEVPAGSRVPPDPRAGAPVHGAPAEHPPADAGGQEGGQAATAVRHRSPAAARRAVRRQRMARRRAGR